MKKRQSSGPAYCAFFEERHEVVRIGSGREDAQRLDRARETFAAMQRGVPIIHRAVLRDAEHRAYGSADFLIRSDVLRALFPEDISGDEASIIAPDLDGADWHYRVVNVKYMTLHLNAAGTELGNGGECGSQGGAVHPESDAGAIAGIPCRRRPTRWEGGGGEEQRRQKFEGNSAMERLGPVPQDGSIARGVPIGDEVERALAWVRRVRTEGRELGDTANAVGSAALSEHEERAAIQT